MLLLIKHVIPNVCPFCSISIRFRYNRKFMFYGQNLLTMYNACHPKICMRFALYLTF